MNTIKGIPASPGIAIGPVFQFKHASLHIERRQNQDASHEFERLKLALTEAEKQLIEVQARASQQTSEEEAAIFEAQAVMLKDPELLGMVQAELMKTRLNVESVWMDTTTFYAKQLEALDNEYLRARAADVRDIAGRVLRILSNVKDDAAAGLSKPAIIFAADLTPSDTINLNKELVLGFCTAFGGETSHTAILARSLGLPAIVGAGEAVTSLSNDANIILDGNQGILILEPEPDALNDYARLLQKEQALKSEAFMHCLLPAITQDGKQVEVVANIGDVSTAKRSVEYGAEGVGLLRSEFLYLERQTMPNEEEQVRAYSEILETFGDKPVVLRTLDIGGDKELPYLEQEKEMNPFLGLRGIRLCLARPQIFKTQLRAALRASYGHNLKLMFPMVAVVSEVRAARALLAECQNELRQEGKPFDAAMEVGIMVEVPSAAIQAETLAREVDFFSIGTNDLTQYTLAVDRTNAGLAYLTNAFSPAVLSLIRDVISAAHKHGKWVGLCGELAGEPLAIPILLGLGLDEFSMNPTAIPIAKKTIRSLSFEACKDIAANALEMEDGDTVKQYVRQFLR